MRKVYVFLHVFAILHHQSPSGKGSTLKGKTLLPSGAKSFLLE